MNVFIPPRDSFTGPGLRTSSLICQATGFSPKKIAVSWLKEGKLLTSGFITDKPEVERKASPVTYRVTSTLTVTESDWLSQSVFTCQVEHQALTFQKNVSSMCSPSEYSRPGRAPSTQVSAQSADLPLTGRQLPEPWLPGEARGGEGAPREACRVGPGVPSGRTPGPRRGSTKLTPWPDHPRPVPGTSTIRVFTIPPTFASIFLTKEATLSCLVTDLATYDSLHISWTRKNGIEIKTNTNISVSHPNATFSATGKATVCVEDWESGEEFTCTVTHTDLPSPLKHTIFRPKGRLPPFLPPQTLPHMAFRAGDPMVGPEARGTHA